MELTPERAKAIEQILNAPTRKRPRRERAITAISSLDSKARRAMGTLARKVAAGPPEERRTREQRPLVAQGLTAATRPRA